MTRQTRSRFRFDRRAATAVEFALVCVPFTTFLLAVMGVGLQYFLQQALDYAAQGAARQVQLGRVPASYTAADFISNIFCPIFGQFQVCINLSVDLRPVTDYQQTNAGLANASDSTATTGLKFCPGQPGQLMYMHVVYLAPMIGSSLLSYGSNAIVANAAFANENPTGISVLPPAC